jgi:hypothetical protein
MYIQAIHANGIYVFIQPNQCLLDSFIYYDQPTRDLPLEYQVCSQDPDKRKGHRTDSSRAVRCFRWCRGFRGYRVDSCRGGVCGSAVATAVLRLAFVVAVLG